MEEKKKNNSVVDLELGDLSIPMVEVPIKAKERVQEEIKETGAAEAPQVNILRNEKVIVRHIPKEGGMVTNPKHVLYGGMAETAVRTFVVPRLRSGSFVNVLTNEEKAYLENIMGFEYGALNSTRKVNNFWKTVSVRLTKQDNYFDMSDPNDYIKVKILLANKDLIAPSLQALQDEPKATYQFVIISEGDEGRQLRDTTSTTMKCYKEYGKVENDLDTLRVIVETIDGRPTARTTKLEFIQERAMKLIQANNKLFLKVITDPYLSTKVLIKKAVESGVIFNRDNHYYLDDNTPLCEPNEEATLSMAAKYLNSPKHQNVLFAIQAKVKE